jgi:hypothetical protein
MTVPMSNSRFALPIFVASFTRLLFPVSCPSVPNSPINKKLIFASPEKDHRRLSFTTMLAASICVALVLHVGAPVAVIELFAYVHNKVWKIKLEY